MRPEGLSRRHSWAWGALDAPWPLSKAWRAAGSLGREAMDLNASVAFCWWQHPCLQGSQPSPSEFWGVEEPTQCVPVTEG